MRKALGNPSLRTYVYSHTHRAELPFDGTLSGPFRPKVVNTGAFQRIVTPEQMNQRFESPQDALRKAKLEDLPRCYSFVVVEPKKERFPKLLRYPIPSQDGWRTMAAHLCERQTWK